MRQIGDIIISDEVWQKRFACNLEKCHGKCCQYGDLGAPISEEEAETIKNTLPHVAKYLSKPSQKFLAAGVSEIYQGSLHIREIAENNPCPLAYISPEKIVYCSLHSHALDNNIPLLNVKPIWCSLFPLMLTKSGNYWMINCHIPEFCHSIDNPPPLLLSFADLLKEFFGDEWIAMVKKAYKEEEAEVQK